MLDFIKRFTLPAIGFAALTLIPVILELMGLEGRALRAELSFFSTLLIWCMFALSYNLIYGITGLLSLAHALFLGAGALAVGIATTRFGLNIWEALGIGFLASAALASLIGALVVQVRGNQFIVATAALALVGSLLAIYFNDWTGGLAGLRIPRDAFSLGIGDLTFLQRDIAYWINFILFVVVILGMGLLIRSPLGLALKAVRENELRAQLIGYRTNWLKWISFTISGATAGLAGAMLALTQGSMDSGLFNWTTSIEALAWVVIGGAGTLLGPIFGAGLLLSADHFLIESLPVSSVLFSGILLIVFAIFAPRGIIGLIRSISWRFSSHAQN